MRVIDTIGVLTDGVLTKYRIQSATDSDAIRALYSVIDEKLKSMWDYIRAAGVFFDDEGYLSQGGPDDVIDIYAEDAPQDSCCDCECCAGDAKPTTEEAMDSTHYIRGYRKRLQKLLVFIDGYHIRKDKDGYIIQVLDSDDDYEEIDPSKYEVDNTYPYSEFMRILRGLWEWIRSFGVFVDRDLFVSQHGRTEGEPPQTDEDADETDDDSEDSDEDADAVIEAIRRRRKERYERHRKRCCCCCSCASSSDDDDDDTDTDDTDTDDTDTEDTDADTDNTDSTDTTDTDDDGSTDTDDTDSVDDTDITDDTDSTDDDTEDGTDTDSDGTDDTDDAGGTDESDDDTEDE